nr:DNA-directed RNA polymerase III subunit RPC7 isoform X5 [Anser cygnoides]
MHVPILYNYCIICSAFLSLVLVPGKRKNGQKCCWCFRNISLLYCRGLPLQKSCNLVMISQRHGLLRAGSSGCFGDSGDKCHRLVTPIDCETVEGNRKAIERYSKKYLSREKEHAAWTPDWRRLPREMKPRKKMKKAFFCRIVNQILQQQLELVLVVLKGKKTKANKQKNFLKVFLLCMTVILSSL